MVQDSVYCYAVKSFLDHAASRVTNDTNLKLFLQAKSTSYERYVINDLYCVYLVFWKGNYRNQTILYEKLWSENMVPPVMFSICYVV